MWRERAGQCLLQVGRRQGSVVLEPVSQMQGRQLLIGDSLLTARRVALHQRVQLRKESRAVALHLQRREDTERIMQHGAVLQPGRIGRERAYGIGRLQRLGRRQIRSTFH
jgi:hypothetical protein